MNYVIRYKTNSTKQRGTETNGFNDEHVAISDKLSENKCLPKVNTKII